MADEARAIARFVRVSPFKVRRVLNVIRMKGVEEALGTLQFLPGRAARAVRKVVESAAANAETNHDMERKLLYVARTHADQGPVFRRFRPGSRLHVHAHRRDTSHITVVLQEREH
jgi:large subunit ribosomal protein L22